jgi:hypothetical protein
MSTSSECRTSVQAASQQAGAAIFATVHPRVGTEATLLAHVAHAPGTAAPWQPGGA